MNWPLFIFFVIAIQPLIWLIIGAIITWVSGGSVHDD